MKLLGNIFNQELPQKIPCAWEKVHKLQMMIIQLILNKDMLY